MTKKLWQFPILHLIPQLEYILVNNVAKITMQSSNNVTRSATSTGCRLLRTLWPERSVRPRALPVPPSYVDSSTGFQSGKESATSLPSSHTRPTQPRLQLTYLTSFTNTILCSLLINCYLLYRECRKHYRRKRFALAPRQSGTHCHTTVDLLDFSVLSSDF